MVGQWSDYFIWLSTGQHYRQRAGAVMTDICYSCSTCCIMFPLKHWCLYMRYATGALKSEADSKLYHCHAKLPPSAEDILGPFLWALCVPFSRTGKCETVLGYYSTQSLQKQLKNWCPQPYELFRTGGWKSPCFLLSLSSAVFFFLTRALDLEYITSLHRGSHLRITFLMESNILRITIWWKALSRQKESLSCFWIVGQLYRCAAG